MLRSNQLSYTTKSQILYQGRVSHHEVRAEIDGKTRLPKGFDGASPYPSRFLSAMFKNSFAFAHKRVHAFFLVFGGKQAVEQAAFEHHAV